MSVDIKPRRALSTQKAGVDIKWEQKRAVTLKKRRLTNLEFSHEPTNFTPLMLRERVRMHSARFNNPRQASLSDEQPTLRRKSFVES